MSVRDFLPTLLTVNVGDLDPSIRCGACREPLNLADEEPGCITDVVAVSLPSGNFIVGRPPFERAIHRCADMTREDQLEAMKIVASHR